MFIESIENSYFRWLSAKVIYLMNPTPSLTYNTLLKHLHNTEFVWIVDGDDNRAADGVGLRRLFLIESRIADDQEWRSLGCSVLEMMIALSRRASFSTDISADRWFWHMIENLGLIECNDANDELIEDIDNVLYSLVWRQYDFCGRGGLFPIIETKNDQRKVELWYQFNEYVENSIYLDV